MDDKKAKTAPQNKEREKEKEEGKKAAAETPKSNKLLFVGIIAAVIVIELVAGFILVKMVMPKSALDAETEMHEDSTARHDEQLTAMGSTTAETPVEVVVNIAGTDGERFLKAAVVLEYEERGGAVKKKEGGGHGEGGPALSSMAAAIMQRLPKYKSYLIEYLSKMTITEVTAPDAKEKIRKDFMRVVNSTLPSELGEVRDIYFTQFIIQ